MSLNIVRIKFTEIMLKSENLQLYINLLHLTYIKFYSLVVFAFFVDLVSRCY